jgi:hypothetical protein
MKAGCDGTRRRAAHYALPPRGQGGIFGLVTWAVETGHAPSERDEGRALEEFVPWEDGPADGMSFGYRALIVKEDSCVLHASLTMSGHVS